jgi:hypothetical protein
MWASHWLAAGYDGPILAEVAGLHGDDPREVRDLLPAALAECGVPATDLDHSYRSWRRAAALTGFILLAERCLDGRLAEGILVAMVVAIVEEDFDTSVSDFPLARLYLLDEEWASDGGRPEEQLREVARQACHDQLRTARALGPAET